MDKIKPVDKLTFDEMRELIGLSEQLLPVMESRIGAEEAKGLASDLRRALEGSDAHTDKQIPVAVQTLREAVTFAEMVDPDRNILLAILLHPLVKLGKTSPEQISRQWGADIASLISGIDAVNEFSARNSATNQENFRGLVLSLAHDIRVIIIMIVKSLVLMRMINRHPDDQWVRNVASRPTASMPSSPTVSAFTR